MTASGPVDTMDLDQCAREPIHIPGAIQPHGCLIALEPDTLVVQQVSANAEAFLGISPAALLGRPLGPGLPQQALESIRQALSALQGHDPVPMSLPGLHLYHAPRTPCRGFAHPSRRLTSSRR